MTIGVILADDERLVRAGFRMILSAEPDIAIVAEASDGHEAVAAARETGARAHILHLSAASALGVIAQAKRDGVRLSVETCPHYLTLTAEEVPDGATAYKCCPPIRDAANRDAKGSRGR